MNKLAVVVLLLAGSASAQTAPPVTEPVCQPIGRTSKGDLVYSMQCRNIPGLPIGDKPAGYDPAPGINGATTPVPAPAAPESK